MKKAIAISALPLALLFAAAFQSDKSVPFQLAAIQSQLNSLQAQVASLANKGPRKFYLTQGTVDGAHALNACTTGYHMASLYEIHEPSNFAYNTELGVTRDDSGFGPPALANGWIRTGVDQNVSNPPGTSNCQAWTSVVAFGTLGRLEPLGSPWSVAGVGCDAAQHVWCVQD